jgi:hypothetical protein
MFSFGEMKTVFQELLPPTTISSNQSKPLFNESFVPSNSFAFSTNTGEFSFGKTTNLLQTKTTNTNDSNVLLKPANVEKETNLPSGHSTTAPSAANDSISFPINVSTSVPSIDKSTFPNIFSNLDVEKTKTNISETNKPFVNEKQFYFGNSTSPPQLGNVFTSSATSLSSQALTYEYFQIFNCNFIFVE